MTAPTTASWGVTAMAAPQVGQDCDPHRATRVASGCRSSAMVATIEGIAARIAR